VLDCPALWWRASSFDERAQHFIIIDLHLFAAKANKSSAEPKADLAWMETAVEPCARYE
jgi:hypothetical protein